MRRVFLLCGVLGAALCSTGASADLRPAPVANPRSGQTVAAGELIEIARSGDFLAPTGSAVREWEVFLSLDGGRSHPIRLTPHLDTAIWRTTVRIPNFATDEARLLVRFGDEREEHEFELPGTFRIEASDSLSFDGTWPIVSPRLDAHHDSGDLPLAGTPRVVAWVESTPDGAWHSVAAPGDAWSSSDTPLLAATEPAEAPSESDSGGPTARTAAATTLDLPRLRARQKAFHRPSSGRASERLSLLRRRNE